MPVNKPHPSVDLTVKANDADVTPAVEASPGVRRIEILAKHITAVERVFLLFGVFLIAYAYSIDATLRSVFQPNATSEFSQHSLLATITVLRSVIAGAAQPTAAKIADVFGRLELILVSIVFHIVGTVIEATSYGVKGFAAGAVFYQVGYTCATLLAEVIIADMTSLRSRLLFSYIFASPYLINTWVSGDISAAVLTHVGWRWGIGMWAIIYPVATLPLISVLMVARYRAKKSGDLATAKTPYQMYGAREVIQALFWQLDAPGIVLLIAVFALILVPFTIAGGEQQQWRTGHVIAPLVVGVLCIPAFIVWERGAPNPMLPFHLLKDRAVWAALYLAVGIGCTWYIQGDYLYTVLVVSYNESVKSATRITQLYSFVSAVTGLVLGLIVYKVRRLKWFIVFGAAVYLVAFGLLIQFRGGGGANHAGLVGAQVVLGVGGSMLSYPAQTSIQAAAKHEHVAVITGLSLGFLSIGSALGNCISGAIWTQVLSNQLNKALEPFGNATLPALVYGAPFLVVPEYPWGSPVREAIVEAYRHTQRLLCITAICIATTLVGFALALRNYRLPDTQSRPDAEKSLAVPSMVVAVDETPEKV